MFKEIIKVITRPNIMVKSKLYTETIAGKEMVWLGTGTLVFSTISLVCKLRPSLKEAFYKN